MRWVSERAPRFACAACIAGALGLVAGPAWADRPVDPSYGRIDGDVTLVGGLGATVSEGGTRPEGELRVRYLESVGLFGVYEDGPLVAASPDPRRVLVGGLEVRPLFLYRWLKGSESRRAWLDLTIDSFGLELGVVAAQPAGQGFASLGGLQAGAALEVPLWAEATGLWLGLHGGIRWSEPELSTGAGHGTDDRQAYLTLSLAWHQVVVAHLVDVGDEAPR